MSEAEATAWGRAIGAALPLGSVIALYGDLGAGKTTLARAICEGFGVVDVAAVTSPTFAIVHEYPCSRGVVVHADLYRIRSEGELEQLGFEELMSRAALTIVEWPERAQHLLPPATARLSLTHDAENTRRRILRVDA